ncbi:MAG: WGR domain-containing protein [Desulfobacteraceae bacterium]|nr:MAG: WGR domain-containing protein [Desulfobacteraceae bacterium]
MKRFELLDGHSNKFWAIEVVGNELTVRFGKIGTNGQTKTKSFADNGKALAEQEKLIREKTGKGYREVSGPNAVLDDYEKYYGWRPSEELSDLSDLSEKVEVLEMGRDVSMTNDDIKINPDNLKKTPEEIGEEIGRGGISEQEMIDLVDIGALECDHCFISTLPNEQHCAAVFHCDHEMMEKRIY